MKVFFEVAGRRVLAGVCTATIILSCGGCANSGDSGLPVSPPPTATSTISQPPVTPNPMPTAEQPKSSNYAAACENVVMEQLVNVDSGMDFSTVDKVFAAADMVLRGSVTAVSMAKYEEGGGLPKTDVTFGCAEILKGTSPVPVTFSMTGGVLPMADYITEDKTAEKTLRDSDLTKEQLKSGYLRVTVGNRLHLTEGEDYIVFLGKNADGSLYMTGLDYGALWVKDGVITDFVGKTYSEIG